MRLAARFRGEPDRGPSRPQVVLGAVALAWQTDAFLAQLCYRAGVACRSRGSHRLARLLHRAAVLSGQVDISADSVVGPGLYLPHGQVVVDGHSVIGPGAVLRPFVVVGPCDGDPLGPRLGPQVRVGTGAQVRGPVRIGARVTIGAGAVVEEDVPAGATVVGAPARIVHGGRGARRGPGETGGRAPRPGRTAGRTDRTS